MIEKGDYGSCQIGERGYRQTVSYLALEVKRCCIGVRFHRSELGSHLSGTLHNRFRGDWENRRVEI